MTARYNIQWEALCSQLKLGRLLKQPQEISGGFLHKVFALHTSRGKYAVKALNPQIMLRSTAMQNYLNSEKIAQLVPKKAHALPAKEFQEKTIQELEGQYYILFDWLPHQSIQQKDIQISHCQKMGEILAHIHNSDFSSLHLPPDAPDTAKRVDWNEYLQLGIRENTTWVEAMQCYTQDLYTWSEQGLATQTLLPPDTISHRDLDPKNTLWKDEEPVLIDWEAAGWINSTQDLLETALYWAQNEKGKRDMCKLKTFIQAYKQIRPEVETGWQTAIQKGTLSQLDWLEYNLKRSLDIECNSDDEKELGSTQVIQSIRELQQYAKDIKPLEDFLQNLPH